MSSYSQYFFPDVQIQGNLDITQDLSVNAGKITTALIQNPVPNSSLVIQANGLTDIFDIQTAATRANLLEVNEINNKAANGNIDINNVGTGQLNMNGDGSTTGVVIYDNGNLDAFGDIAIYNNKQLLINDTATLNLVGENCSITLGTAPSLVIQGTSITTAVTSNAIKGNIQTVAATLAAGASASFDVNCNKFVNLTNMAIAVVSDYSGTWDTNGFPVISKITQSVAGKFTIQLTNFHSANALNGTITISYQIV